MLNNTTSISQKNPYWVALKAIFGFTQDLDTALLLCMPDKNNKRDKVTGPLGLARIFSGFYREKAWPFQYSQYSIDRSNGAAEKKLELVVPKLRILKGILLPLTFPIFLLAEAFALFVFAPIKAIWRGMEWIGREIWKIMPEGFKNFIKKHPIISFFLGLALVAGLVFGGIGIAAVAGSAVAAGILVTVGKGLAAAGVWLWEKALVPAAKAIVSAAKWLAATPVAQAIASLFVIAAATVVTWWKGKKHHNKEDLQKPFSCSGGDPLKNTYSNVLEVTGTKPVDAPPAAPNTTGMTETQEEKSSNGPRQEPVGNGRTGLTGLLHS